MTENQTTTITHISWGRMEVTTNGRTQTFKDCKVWPGGAKKWDWNKTGTRHRPGTQPADIAEILEKDIDVMVLSRGMNLALHTHPDTEKLLKEKGIEYHIEETNAAVDRFNKLNQQGRRAGGIFHSTC